MQKLMEQELSKSHIGKQVTFETRQYNSDMSEHESTGEYKTGVITHYRPDLPIPCYLVEVDGDTYPWCVNKEMIQENPRLNIGNELIGTIVFHKESNREAKIIDVQAATQIAGGKGTALRQSFLYKYTIEFLDTGETLSNLRGSELLKTNTE